MAIPIIPGSPSIIEVTTFARLHMGFFDLNGNLGRRFGSIGLSLDSPYTKLQARKHAGLSVQGPSAPRAEKLARIILSALQIKEGIKIELKQAIPEHSGLGSGTQMALAVGTAISKLYDIKLTARDIAGFTSRGARSGIGLGTFDLGGVIVDGGRGPDTITPPVISHLTFPAAWTILLIFDQSAQGVHGAQEVEAFKQLAEFPETIAADLCRRVLMQALPALAETNLRSFGQAIRALQEATGDYFSPVQGGRYASQAVAEVLNYLSGNNVECLGQSSWGPTAFAVFADETQSQLCLDQLQSRYDGTALRFQLCKGLNQGSVSRFLNDA